VLIAGLAATAFYAQQRLHQAIEHDFPQFSNSERLASWAMNIHLDELEWELTRLARLEDLKEALRAGDRGELLEQMRPPLNRLGKGDLRVTRFTCYRADGRVLLRAHAPESYGDEVFDSRRLVAQAFRTRTILRGLEVDEGQLFLWAVAPVYDRGRVIGVLEMGTSLMPVVETIKSVAGGEAGVLGTDPHTSVGASSDPRLFAVLARRLLTESTGERGRTISAGGKTYAATTVPLIDVAGRRIGTLAIVADASTITAVFRHSMAVTGTIGIAAFALVALILALLARRLGGIYGGLEARVEERTIRLRTLMRLNQLVSSSLDTADVLRAIAEAAAELIDVTAVWVWIADEPGKTLAVRACSDERLLADYPLTTVRFGEGFVGWAAAHRSRLAIPDLAADPRLITREWFSAHNVRSGYFLPIMFQDRLLGVLGLLGRAAFRFGPEDEDLLDGLVTQAAIAMHNAQLYGEIHHRQDQLVQSERLRALGEMAAGVAHDFNNVLAAILARAEMLLEDLRDSTLAREVQVIYRAALDGAQTVRRIQEFTRTRRTRPTGRVDLEVVVREVVELTRPRWKDEAQRRGVRYDIRVDGGPVPPVTGQPEELREVFTNMLINALEAMPSGGRFVFRLDHANTWVSVRAIDSGCGMTEEARGRVFEPFFTTKGSSGTGLGLAVAFGIVTRHGGTIDVESKPAGGTTFTVRLPVGVVFEEAAPERPAAGRATRARILVVDDERDVLSSLSEILTGHGYEVVQASDGREALAWAGTGAIDLVLSDISMPEMSGWQLAAAWRATAPSVPIMFVTGWGGTLDPRQLEAHDIRVVLGKPFRTADVLNGVADALAAASPSGPASLGDPSLTASPAKRSPAEAASGQRTAIGLPGEPVAPLRGTGTKT